MFVYFLGIIDTSLQGFILRLGELIDRSYWLLAKS